MLLRGCLQVLLQLLQLFLPQAHISGSLQCREELKELKYLAFSLHWLCNIISHLFHTLSAKNYVGRIVVYTVINIVDLFITFFAMHSEKKHCFLPVTASRCSNISDFNISRIGGR